MSNQQKATLRVVGSPELLILIFSHLSPVDLFFSAQHVSHTWHQVTLTTRQLQDRIYYRTMFPEEDEMKMNPILKHALPMFFQSRKWVDVFSFIDKVPAAAIANPEASFREMPVYVNGQPVRELRVLEETFHGGGFRQRRGVLDLPEGVLTMGTLVDLTMNWCASHPDASFLVRWRKDLLTSKEEEERRRRPVLAQPETVMGGLWTRVLGGLAWVSGSRVRDSRTTPAPSYATWDSYSEYPIPVGPRGNTGRHAVEVVLFKVINVRFKAMTDIVDMDLPAVMPEEWGEKEGMFGASEVKFDVLYDQAPSIIHSFRSPKRTLKYR